MKLGKKLLALGLAFALVLSLGTMSAFAAVTITPVNPTAAKPSHTVPDTYAGKIVVSNSSRFATVSNESRTGGVTTSATNTFTRYDGGYATSGTTLVSAASFISLYNDLVDAAVAGVTNRAQYTTGRIGQTVTGTNIKKGANWVQIQIGTGIFLIGIEGESVIRGAATDQSTMLSGTTAVATIGILSAGNATVPNQVRDGNLMIFMRGLWDGIGFPVAWDSGTNSTNIYATTGGPVLATANTNKSIGDLATYTVTAINIAAGNSAVQNVYNYQNKTIQLAGNVLSTGTGVQVAVNVGDKYLVDESNAAGGTAAIALTDIKFFLQGTGVTALQTGTYIVPVGALGNYTKLTSGTQTWTIETGPPLQVQFGAVGDSVTLGN
jgi:hypothetical protein